MECRDTQVSCIAAKSLAEPPEACRPQEGLKSEAPKHPEILGSAIRRAPHREAFILHASKDRVSRIGWHSRETHTNLKKVTHPGRPTRLVEP